MNSLYDHYVDWYPLLDPAHAHAEEGGLYGDLLRDALRPPTDRPSLLELGSGAGNNAVFLAERFDCTLVDPSPGMLALSVAQNPGCRHVEGDMRTVELGRSFDAVLIHDAIVYMTTEADLRAALVTAYRHLRPGGAALFAPDYVTETFDEGIEPLGDDDGHRSLRGTAWVWDPDPGDTSYRTDYALLLRDGTDLVSVHTTDTEGLFPRATWLRLLAEVGFEAEAVPRELEDGWSDEIFLGRRPLI
ncbi:MAG: SAM-dependent methyltransferase [Myxococcota bacterium]|jgi:SAM-dependent methyltransferase